MSKWGRSSRQARQTAITQTALKQTALKQTALKQTALKMAHHLGKIHFVDKRSLDRVNSAIMLGLVVSGLAVCGIGAAIYDVGGWFSAW